MKYVSVDLCEICENVGINLLVKFFVKLATYSNISTTLWPYLVFLNWKIIFLQIPLIPTV